MFNKSAVHLKGLRTDAVGVLWRALKRREAAGDILVITIDEYLTSRTYNNCRSNTVEALKTVPGRSTCLENLFDTWEPGHQRYKKHVSN
ncbi:hypothetical protein BDF20DRAFT_888191 [Mycotypha africana]|uniref:uncharacterized protein n=1 Tax=Mycotypha africana TaxID=64632 RepID=UPI002301BA0F|nr:uncharacterized protein BDF20DRAFT_888191 [Mycotypha africana]KAI8972046.1 hypothetical protein BDF20DRAFT_888191 [Mycotypha africana]